MSSGSEPCLIELRKVMKIYGQGESEVRALAGVDMRIEEGEFVAVMCPSGSGKSTCMNMLGCLDSPTSGSYFFRGVDVAGLSSDQLALLRRHYLGFVFQGYNLLARTTTPKSGQKKGARVWVVNGLNPVEVPVKSGASDGRLTEILTGEVLVGTEVIVDAVEKK